jgi:hypothetical protein
MVIVTLQQIIDERISFLEEQINQDKKPEVNRTFQLQIDAIRSVDDHIERVESIIRKRRHYSRIAKTCMNPIDCLQSLMVWNGCSGK